MASSNNAMPEDLKELIGFLEQRKASPLQSAPTNAVPNPAPEPATFTGQLAPLASKAADAALTIARNLPPRALEATGNLSWFDRNQRKDAQGRVIPIDIESGLNLGEFSRVVWQRRPEERIAVLRKMFPNNVVRRADTGEPIIEVTGPGGSAKDVLLNPPGGNVEDVIEAVQGAAGQTVGGTAGMLAGQAIGSRLGPAGSAIGKIGVAAIGSAIGGAVQDITARKAEGLPLDPSEIAREQSKQAALNAMFDAGGWAGAKSLRATSPFATSRGPLQFNLQEGKKYFREVHGVEFKTTPAEESGAPILQRIEKTESKLPGSMTVLGRIYERGQEQISRIYDAALGRRVSDEELGRSIMNTVRSKLVEPVEAQVEQARTKLIQKGETELAAVVDSIAAASATKKEAGEATREAFKQARAVRDAATKKAYAELRTTPGGDKKILSGNPMDDAAKEIEAELPTVLKSKEVPSYDSYGNPIARTKVTKETLGSGVPEGLQKFLADMHAQRGQKMTIQELTTLKNAARDEIAKTEAVPGVKDRWFGKISAAYDQAIQDQLDAMPDGKLKAALSNAKETYKREMLPLDREGLHDILRTEFESGFQSPEQLINRLFSGARAEHNYRMLEDVLGKASPAFSKIKRAVMDNWVLDATDPVTKRIQPAKLEASMLGLRSAHPDIYKSVVGPNEQQLFKITASLRAAGQEWRNIDKDELAALLQRGSITKNEVQGLINAQESRDYALANDYLKNLAQGKRGVISPSEFVDSLFNSKIDAQHLNNVLGAAEPGELEKLQTAALYRIATKASQSNVDMAKFLANEQSPVQAFALAKALGPVGSLERERNELLLGPNYRELVRQTISVLAPREVKTGLFGAAGGMAATGIIQKLLEVPLQYVSKWAQKSIAASLYTSEPVKKLLINTVEGPMETAAFANMLIASEPFVKKLTEVYGSDAAYSIVRDAKASIDRFVAQDTTVPEPQAQFQELVNFLKTGKGKIKVEAK